MTDNELKALVASLAIDQKETAAMHKEIAAEHKEIAAMHKEIAVEQQELFAAQKELSVAQKETDEQMKRTDEQMKRTDEQMKRTDEQLKRTDEKLERMGITLGNMGRNQGDVAEEFFYHSLIDNLSLGDIAFDDITKNMERHRGKIQEEYDLFLTNGKAIAVIEVKYKAHINDLDKLDRKVANFKKLFPIYEDYNLYGGFASFHINDDIKTEALSRGYFLLQRSGNVVQTMAENLKVS